MPRPLKKLDSAVVQGAGSYVAIRPLLWQEMRTIQKKWSPSKSDQTEDAATAAADEDANTTQVLADVVMEWNWTDNEGKALPLPRTDKAILQRLTTDEVRFLIEAIIGAPPKN